MMSSSAKKMMLVSGRAFPELAEEVAACLGIKPTPVFLKPGDVMTLSIQNLGVQKQRVVAYQG